MTYEEYFKSGYLPKIIDEYCIMHAHSLKLRVYLAHLADEGCPDEENQYYLRKMQQIMKAYEAYLGSSQ